jgi:hypothetical protein
LVLDRKRFAVRHGFGICIHEKMPMSQVVAAIEQLIEDLNSHQFSNC